VKLYIKSLWKSYVFRQLVYYGQLTVTSNRIIMSSSHMHSRGGDTNATLSHILSQLHRTCSIGLSLSSGLRIHLSVNFDKWLLLLLFCKEIHVTAGIFYLEIIYFIFIALSYARASICLSVCLPHAGKYRRIMRFHLRVAHRLKIFWYQLSHSGSQGNYLLAMASNETEVGKTAETRTKISRLDSRTLRAVNVFGHSDFSNNTKNAY